MIATIREVNFSDQEQVARLQNKYGIQADSIEDWNRLWKSNPEFAIESPIGWVLEYDNKIVGYLGNVPLLYYYQGRKVNTRSARGWVVEDNFRSQAIHLALKYLTQKNADLLINSSSNEPTFNIFKTLGCITPKGVDFSCSFLWIISPIKFAEAIFLRFHNSKKLNKILIFIISTCLELIKSLSSIHIAIMRLIYKIKFPDVTFKELDPSSNEFNHLFSCMMAVNEGILADRSSRKLSWFSSRNGVQIFILGCYIKNILSGYTLLTIKNIFSTKILKAELTDYVTPKLNPLIMKYMLIEAIDFSNKKNVAFFEVNPGTQFINYVSKGLLPIKRARFSTPFTFKVLNEEIIQKDAVMHLTWELITNYDGDSGL